MSAATEYAELLKLIEITGPFLSLPIYKDVFPQGLIKDNTAATSLLHEAYDEWREAREKASSLVSPRQREWIRMVLHDALGWPDDMVAEHNAIPQTLLLAVPQHQETLRPDLVLMQDGNPCLLIQLLPPGQEPDRRPPGTTWNASCVSRMAELLTGTGVPLGLVTNGERWTLVYAERQQPTGTAEWRAELWFEERLTLRAFRDLLGAESFFSRPSDQTLAALYRRSLENQQEVSTTLGRQVRRAVELFVAALDRADREQQRSLLRGVKEETVYEASLSLMMRLVFLLFAEERDLLPLSNPVYRDYYAISTMHAQLREDADAHGEEVLEHRYDGFPRLLATFRAVHSGAEHDLFTLPAYGGHLFDPDRYAFLEGRAPETNWRETAASPISASNRTVLHLLEALQFLEMKVPGGGTEKRRVSFRALDIEQIGHVYEGLLDHTAKRAGEPVLGLSGPDEPEIALAEMEARKNQAGFIDWLADRTGRSAAALEKALRQELQVDTARWPLWERVKPFAPLVRMDDNRDPSVIREGSIYVTTGTARRQSGTQYTPRSLTREVVRYALEPVCYDGPAEGRPASEWILKNAAKLLDLKICDPACGSGAFLAEACRYLSDRLAEAWDIAEQRLGPGVKITPYGDPSLGLPDEALLPANKEERALIARRLVAQRCLYGVDKNPLAAEMAKLSLWLLTLEKAKPFTFLDHAIRCGDSLLGVSLKQLEFYDLSGTGEKATQLLFLNDDLSYASERRDGLSKIQYRPDDQERMLNDALVRTRRARAAADLLIATAFEENAGNLAQQVSMGLEQQEAAARTALADKRPFHWPVEFPEVFVHGEGFDVVIGNPPFIGSKYWASAVGEYLTKYSSLILGRKPGHSDICALFHRRAFELIHEHGYTGLLGCDSLRDGDSYIAGLEVISKQGHIYRAHSSLKWPGSATVRICVVWTSNAATAIEPVLDDKAVAHIDGHLNEAAIASDPHVLKYEMITGGGCHNARGESLLLMSSDTWYGALRDAKSPYLRLYVTNEDMADHAFRRSNRWCIYCGDSSLEEVKDKSQVTAQFLHEVVRPLRTPEYLSAFPGLPNRWWQFHRPAADLYKEVTKYTHCLVLGMVTKYLIPARVPSSWICTNKLCVVAESRADLYGILTAQYFEDWVRFYSGSLGETLSLSLKRAVQTFPLPLVRSDRVTGLGSLIAQRYEGVFDARKVGYTDLYNAIHTPTDRHASIEELRNIRAQLDQAVAEAYGWAFDLGHGFHQTKQGLRYTISESARSKVLDLLLDLNHVRHAAEIASAPPSKPKRVSKKESAAQNTLF